MLSEGRVVVCAWVASWVVVQTVQPWACEVASRLSGPKRGPDPQPASVKSSCSMRDTRMCIAASQLVIAICDATLCTHNNSKRDSRLVHGCGTEAILGLKVPRQVYIARGEWINACHRLASITSTGTSCSPPVIPRHNRPRSPGCC